MNKDAALIQETLAARLALATKPGGLAGTLDGAPIEVLVTVFQHHHDGHVAVLNVQTGTFQQVVHPVQLSVKATLPFRPRLDAGLAVGPVGGHAALQAAARVGPDQRLAVKGREAARTAVLLAPEVLAHLDRSFVGDPGPTVGDDGITWSWTGTQPWPPVEALAEAISALPPAWRAIREAAKTAPPPEGVRDAYVVLAGMELVAGVEPWGCPAGVIGEVDGLPVSVTVAPFHTGAWLTKASVRLPRVIPGNPKIVREDRFFWFERLLARLGGRPEVEVGDDRFDDRFTIRTLKPDALTELLDADVREAMLALDGLIAVQLGPTSIEAQGPLTREKDLVSAVQATLALARFVARAGA